MSATIIQSGDFLKVVGSPIKSDFLIEILRGHNIEYDIIYSPSFTVEERIANLAKYSNYVAICINNDFDGSDMSLLLCWIIYIEGLDQLTNIIQKSIKMKAFI